MEPEAYQNRESLEKPAPGLDSSTYLHKTCIVTQINKRTLPQTPKQAAACCGPIDALLDADLFKALSDPTRMKLFACIAKCGRACSVGEVAQCCSVDFSVVSRHLALLAQSGALEAKKSGRMVQYAVRYVGLSRALRALADAIEKCDVNGAGLTKSKS